MAYGMTFAVQKRFAAQLADIIKVDAEIINKAIDEITKAEVWRVTKNDIAEAD